MRQIIGREERALLASTFKENARALRFFEAVSKRIGLGSVRELAEDNMSPFHSFVINESLPRNAA